MADLYYYEAGYIDESYFVYTADAESAVSSQVNLTAVVGVIKQATVALSSEFTQTVMISHIEGADLFAMSNASLAAEVSRIRDNNIDVASAFAQVVSGAKFMYVGSDQNAEFNITADNLRVRNIEAAVDAAFSSEAIANRTRNVIASLTTRYSTYSQNVAGTDDAVGFFFRPDMDSYRQIEPGWYVDGQPTWVVTAVDHTVDSGQSSQITITGGQFVSGSSYRFVKLAGSYSALTTDGQRLRFGEANLTSEFSQACDATVIGGGVVVEASGEWTANFSLSAVISHIEGVDLSAFTNASVSAIVDKFTGISASVNANASIVAYALKIQSSAATLESNTTQSATSQLIIGLASDLTATAITNATALRIQDFTVNLTGAFTPILTVDVFKNSFAVLESQATISANTIVNKSFITSLTSTSSVSATVQKLKIASANFNSAFSLSAPYLSFSNKHPHSLAYVGTPYTGAGITSTQKYVGTYSYFTGSGSDTSNSLQILGTNSTVINSGQDFIISAQIRPTSLGNVAETADYYLLQAYDWALGYRVSGGNAFAAFYYKTNSTTFTRLSVGVPGYLEINRWNQFEVKRIGSTITLTFYNALDGTTTATATYGGAITDSRSIDTPVYFNALRNTYGVYYDEIFFAKGVSSVSSYTGPGAIDDGALTTTEWLFNFENGYRDQTTGKQLAAAALASSSSLTALITLNKTAAASLNSTSTVTANATRIKQADATLSSNGFVAVVVGRIRPFVDIEVATFTLTAEGSKTKQASATLSATTDLTSQLVKIANVQSSLNVNSSLDVSFVHNVEFISTESSAFSVSCNANRLREITTSLENTVDLTALSEVTKTTSATFVSNTTQAIEYTRIQETTVSAQAFASELVVLAKVLRSFANLEIKSTLTAVISVTSSRIKADLVANCSVNIDADKISGLKANLVSQSALLAITGVKVSFSANLSCQGFVLTSGIVINLDDSAVWIIPYENTIWQVTEESQTEEIIYLVPSETRAWVISNEPNDYTVAFEDRSYKLRG